MSAIVIGAVTISLLSGCRTFNRPQMQDPFAAMNTPTETSPSPGRHSSLAGFIAERSTLPSAMANRTNEQDEDVEIARDGHPADPELP